MSHSSAELQPLADKLDSAFQAHDWLLTSDYFVNHRSQYLDDPFVTDCRIANLDDLFESDWKYPPRNTALQRWDSPRLLPWADTNVDRLIWSCTHNAQVRPATTKQLNELKAKRLADRAHPDGPPQQQRDPIVLNGPPRANYGRPAPEFDRASRAAQFAQLGAAHE